MRFVRYRGYEKTPTDRDALAYLIRTGLNVLAGERVLATVSPEDAEALRLAIAGNGTAEVARALGITYTAAASRLHRAKTRAKEIMDPMRKKPSNRG